MSASIGQSTAHRVNAGEPGLPATPITGPTDYRIGPLDLLEVMVFGSEDLSRTVRVTASGEFSLPLVGLINVKGLTVAEVQEAIAKQLATRYMENPQVSVFVKEYMSQRVTVEGAVRNPGVFALTGRTSLLQMVALSGGLDRDSNPGGIVIYRSIEDRRRAAVFDLRKIRSGEIIDPEVLGSDVVVVDYSGIRSSLRDILTATPLLAVFLTVL
jgi:polysaccharide export outer membrane protein